MSKRNRFQQNFWKYLLVVLVPIVVWYTVFYFVYRVKDNEQVQIMFLGKDLDNSALKGELTTNLTNIAGEKLKSVTVRSTVVANGNGQILSAYQVVYDIIIFSESYLPENVGQNWGFAHFEQEKFVELFGADVELYSEVYEETTLYYAVEIPADSFFAQYYSGEEKCYMFFSPETVNLASLNGNGNASDDGAIRIAQYLLSSANR